MRNEPSRSTQLIVFRMVLAILGLILCFYTDIVYAAINTDVDAEAVLLNLSKAFPELMRLVTAIAYVMGMFMIIRGVAGLKEYGESRASRADHHSLKGALTLLICGTLLLYLPSSVQTGLSTFWTDPNPYAYDTGTHDSWFDFTQSIFLIVQLIGTIAFIRGLVIMSHMGQSHSQSNFGKAMAHIVGGILCINLYQFIQVILNTLNLGQI